MFVDLGVPVTGAEPPADAVMPPMDEFVRLFERHGCEILGPPPSLADLASQRNAPVPVDERPAPGS